MFKDVLSRDHFVSLKSRPPELTQTFSLKQTYDPDRCLEDETWFHGVLPREEVVRLLVNEGDYLVRETTRNDEQQVVLSVCWGSHKHFIIQTSPEVRLD